MECLILSLDPLLPRWAQSHTAQTEIAKQDGALETTLRESPEGKTLL